MENLDESKQTYDDLKSENETKINGNEAIVHLATVTNDGESIQLDSNKNLISFTSTSSSVSSNFSVEDLQMLETDDNLANHNEDIGYPETSEYETTSHVRASKILTGAGSWSMASNESLFSIRMDSTSFRHLDNFSPVLEKEEDEGDQFSATSKSSSSSDSFVFPILSGEMENDDSPYPRGSLIEPMQLSPPKVEPAPESRSMPAESEAEIKETTTFITWTTWFPCKWFPPGRGRWGSDLGWRNLDAYFGRYSNTPTSDNRGRRSGVGGPVAVKTNEGKFYMTSPLEDIGHTNIGHIGRELHVIMCGQEKT
ncbi:hypothetical protein QVD17_10593 [Tagetes erecta]|uniref:Uncharacterized protein n=1 Tax=Tagetes erecta TaxID=13708 RepID=A0AAD8L391_TARER|nr:hypothetical protein QVD17_10593 [Tagetes erecta]